MKVYIVEPDEAGLKLLDALQKQSEAYKSQPMTPRSFTAPAASVRALLDRILAIYPPDTHPDKEVVLHCESGHPCTLSSGITNWAIAVQPTGAAGWRVRQSIRGLQVVRLLLNQHEGPVYVNLELMFVEHPDWLKKHSKS